MLKSPLLCGFCSEFGDFHTVHLSPTFKLAGQAPFWVELTSRSDIMTRHFRPSRVIGGRQLRGIRRVGVARMVEPFVRVAGTGWQLRPSTAPLQPPCRRMRSRIHARKHLRHELAGLPRRVAHPAPFAHLPTAFDHERETSPIHRRPLQRINSLRVAVLRLLQAQTSFGKDLGFGKLPTGLAGGSGRCPPSSPALRRTSGSIRRSTRSLP